MGSGASSSGCCGGGEILCAAPGTLSRSCLSPDFCQPVLSIPGPMPWPFIGNFLLIARGRMEGASWFARVMLKKVRPLRSMRTDGAFAKYGHCFRLVYPGRPPLILVSDPES